METKLIVDDKEIVLNKFVNNILSGTVVGAVTSLRDIRAGWKKIEIKVTK